MRVWVWFAIGPGDYSGVTDNPERSRALAEERLRDGRATASVERAWAVAGGGAMQSHYIRSGRGWSAERGADGAFAWEPFTAPVAVS